jgi:hypothetical protein
LSTAKKMSQGACREAAGVGEMIRSAVALQQNRRSGVFKTGFAHLIQASCWVWFMGFIPG